MNYKQMPLIDGKENQAILRADGACIPFDQSNTDYQAYLLWLAEGNTPSSPDEAVEAAE
jgi:hypothetical protein